MAKIDRSKLDSFWHQEIKVKLKQRYTLPTFKDKYTERYSAAFLESIWYGSSTPGLKTVQYIANNECIDFPELTYFYDAAAAKKLAPNIFKDAEWPDAERIEAHTKTYNQYGNLLVSERIYVKMVNAGVFGNHTTKAYPAETDVEADCVIVKRVSE